MRHLPSHLSSCHVFQLAAMPYIDSTTATMLSYFLLLVLSGTVTTALPKMRTAPEECPLQNGNLIDTILFIENSTDCEAMCSTNVRCLFFYYYPGTKNNDVDARKQPAQCFLYDECNRRVLTATEKCPLNKYVKRL
jgi:hypothetical protein